MNDVKVIFPLRLLQAMHDIPMSSADLMRRAGITRTTLGVYKNGAALPNVYTAAKIASVLKVSLDWLVGLSDRGGPQIGQRTAGPERTSNTKKRKGVPGRAPGSEQGSPGD